MSGDIEIVNTVAQPALSVRERVKVADMSAAIGRMFGEVAGCMQRNNVQMAGPPFALYHSWSDQDVDMECGFPSAGPSSGEGNVKSLTLPAVKAAATVHVGPYGTIVETYTKVEKYVGEKGMELAPYMWEFYLNSPQEVPPEKLMTRIIWPIK
ncbi:GyrI-like domain-containing protein [Methanomassiliicoccus luminyensis]|jgi:effector-binding domain-containing protein|uniref:GyrI-like domain-containing protein n=1 Tax=Methanomassiliicoccus luminyensis TaxID=1080712 RepID=UPI0003687662|nr:GyrI-like domain-containing protein [Methanomassiliicoccus luminyensis]